MKVQDAQNIAHDLMRLHNLVAWELKFDNATRRFGYCDFRNKIISLSKSLTELNSEDRVRNTILHEIAHALTPGAGHAWRWRLTARAIGCDGSPRYDADLVVLPSTSYGYKHVAICERHNIRIPRRSFNLGLVCKKCCDELNYGKYDLQYQFKWESV